MARIDWRKRDLSITDIGHVGHAMNETEEADDPSDQLVEVDVTIQRQDGIESGRPQPRDAPPQRHQQHEKTIEVQTLTCNVNATT